MKLPQNGIYKITFRIYRAAAPRTHARTRINVRGNVNVIIPRVLLNSITVNGAY